MTHENEIDKKMNEEFEEFRQMKYTGSVPPPRDLLDLFKKALMEIPYDYHKLNMVKVREIVELKDVSDLTLMNIGVVTNFLHKVPPKSLFGSAYKYCEYMISLDTFIQEYNRIWKPINEKLEKKKEALKNTSGIIRNTGKMIGGKGRILSATR